MSQHYTSHRPHDSYINVLLLSLLLGLFFPAIFAPLNTYSTFLLQGIFFLSSLKINIHEIRSALHHWKTILAATFFMLILLPLGSYFLALWIFPPIAIPILLLAAMPSGMTSPLLVSLIRGNVPLALIITASTSFFAPLTIPFILNQLLDQNQHIALWHMFMTLLTVIFLPFLLAQGVRLWLSSSSVFVRVHSFIKPLSFGMMCLLFASISAKYSETLRESFTFESALALIGMLLFFLSIHVIAYNLFWRHNLRDRLTIVLCIVYMNFTLAIFIAQQFFPDPKIIFFTLLSIIPWNIGIILFRFISNQLSYTKKEL